MSSARTPCVSLLSSTGSISTLASSLREICHYLHQPSTWGNQQGELTTLHQRSRLQQATTRGQEPDLAHSKDSRSRQTSLPPHQDRSGSSCARSNTAIMAKCSVS